MVYYQDHLIKFVQLRLLKNKRVEVANYLVDIFTIFGEPNILQSDNGKFFSNKIVKKICMIGPELKIVCSKSQGF